MRNVLCTCLLDMAPDPNFVFLTGDLGYMALEPLAEALGERFINAGVAEQNMISVAAAMAREGFKAWTYSIAPFLYARPYEQIRNDICLHGLPVKLIGNGGGYAYGVMGSTHHAIEDYGALLCLPGMKAYVPAFADDVAEAIQAMDGAAHPCYLRLGRDEKPASFALPKYAAWRQLTEGGGPVVVVVGPLVGGYLDGLSNLPERLRPNLWVVSELPIAEATMPDDFRAQVRAGNTLLVVEEHVRQGGAGQMLAHALLSGGDAPVRFVHRHALGYPSGRYGSQPFHRKECSLDAQSILEDVRNLCPN